MPVFKAYFKVIRKNWPSLMIYFALFLVVSILFIGATSGKTTNVFDVSRTSIAFFYNDAPSALTDGLRTYLDSSARIVSLADAQETLQDALFYGKVSYILRVPQGFEASFMGGSDSVPLQKTTAPNSTGSVSIDMLVDKYLNLVQMYRTNLPAMSEHEIVASVLKDLSVSVTVNLEAGTEQRKTADLADYFRIQAYPIIAILLMGVTAIMMAFNQSELSRRNQCTPIRPSKMSLMLFLGNTLFAVAVWLALCIVAMILNRNFTLSPTVLLLCLNALAFTVVSLSIGFLAGKFIRSPIAQAAVANVVSLGMSFLSGVFLDQYLLGDTVLKIASFTPGFWYIKGVDVIRGLTSYGFDSLKPLFADILIQLAFAAACIVIALVASKQKRQTLENYVW
jgi:ABC-2 type transport system permease protein